MKISATINLQPFRDEASVMIVEALIDKKQSMLTRIPNQSAIYDIKLRQAELVLQNIDYSVPVENVRLITDEANLRQVTVDELAKLIVNKSKQMQAVELELEQLRIESHLQLQLAKSKAKIEQIVTETLSKISKQGEQ